MPPSTSSHGGVDPSAPGTIIRGALAVESVVTVGVGAYFMFFPRHYLIHTMGATAAQATKTAIQCAQQYGAANVLVGATVGLFTSNSRVSIEARPILYRVVLVFELLYAPFLVWQGLTTQDGMPRSALFAAAAQFVPFVAWRVFTLGWKPEWFGRYLEGKKVE
ncbi:hypothetical protein T440DRAFT_463936 [Plenodomus tracheiphilus IPT5]|uniref:Uncharacterized protein n=1 Tax=Plenodomus tracheiphilus IPT5 TaxID=1408161 RepID=A0A6A7BJ50_9PLEO|nr:hypothetical protein T440DRAFT_463936 [Plenodomus tracheiphilus IPT5]